MRRTILMVRGVRKKEGDCEEVEKNEEEREDGKRNGGERKER